jgi:protein-tyrosine phosphatase
MFGIFKKKEKKNDITFDYSNIAVDMHSHVLPGIDDGAKDLQESIVLVREMMALGIKKIIATPHIMVDYYRNTPETINNALEILKAELKKEGMDIPIEAAAEHYFDETFERRVADDELMVMQGGHVLFEYSFITQPPNAFPVVQKIRDKGYKPILAHPERYPYLDIDQLRGYRDWGILLQINTISLTGYYGREAKKAAEAMIDNDLVDFIASDMHHLRHAEALRYALKTPYVEKLLFDYPLKNIMLR